MKFMLLLWANLGYVAVSKGSLDELPVHPGVGGLYKGPNSETIIKGPDGSVITAQQEGGSVVTQDLSQPIVVADVVDESIQPVISTVSPPLSVVTPIVAPKPLAAITATAPVAIVTPAETVIPVPVGHTLEIIQPDPHIIETEIVDAPVIEPQQSFDLVGPSGSIFTRGSTSVVSGPASTTISEPAKVIVGAPLVTAVPLISTVTAPLRTPPVIHDSVTSSISTATVSSIATVPGIVLSSSVPPVVVSTFAPSTNILSTTATSPTAWEVNGGAETGSSLSTRYPNIGALIQPASTYGVVNTPGGTLQVPSTPRPEITRSSTLAPLVNSNQGVSLATDLDPVHNRQLTINPSLIPSANIVPPEIGPLPPSAADLGSTVIVSTTPAAPASISVTELSNIQRINNDNSIAINGGRISPLVTNQISTPHYNVLDNGVSTPQQKFPFPFERASNPIPGIIPSGGLIGTQLANYGIDSSHIGLANVPLSSVSRLPQAIDQEIDELSAQLWGRYGRDVKEKKDKTKVNKE